MTNSGRDPSSPHPGAVPRPIRFEQWTIRIPLRIYLAGLDCCRLGSLFRTNIVYSAQNAIIIAQYLFYVHINRDNKSLRRDPRRGMR
jgi:hypothetical protein